MFVLINERLEFVKSSHYVKNSYIIKYIFYVIYFDVFFVEIFGYDMIDL